MPRTVGTTAADAGRREHYILIEQLVEGQAGSNFPTETWTRLQNAWAARDFVTLDEEMKSDQLSASTVTEWDIPYSTFMDPDQVEVAKTRRIVYKGRTFDILSGRLNQRGSGRSIVIQALAKVG